MILGHEPESESVINRQNDKIQFLQNENIQLHEDIKDLQRALTLNQDMLKITQQKINFSANNNASQQPPKSFSKEQTYLQDGQEAHNIAYLQEILEKKNQENKILLQTYNRCIKERNELGTKNLLHQQINEETTKFYKDVVQDIEEKVLELRRIIQDKEYTIQTLEKKIYLPDRDGVLMKIKEITSFIRQQLNYQQSHGSSLQKHKEKHSGMKSPRSPTSRMDLIVQMDELNAKFDKLKKLYFKATLNWRIIIIEKIKQVYF
ncbi:hypothetical protein PPERSA_03611 [Pseudocohnilembus persalinus]|uniref:Uncharacterized protein n=1 Tax=Pseudocohnilembus persalinus TaxID=266149 RepID=A0A0V0QE34_PSEPJ|nr:hypothetical protein PPERSA_03611 [Pseudocohnilembus persalinus]|eukprot:KRX00390.1 hypothetical protein PPERSA_03611 [Pseudocohnilembus persalinus]